MNLTAPKTEPHMKLPETVLPDVAWSFQEALSASYVDFLTALLEYGREASLPANEDELSSKLPFSFVDIEYEYGAQMLSGEWKDVTEVIRLRPPQPLTRGELLYEIHKASHGKLRDQDHCFFEGLSLVKEENEPGVPVYEMYLGS
jgi:hypothetical protein